MRGEGAGPAVGEEPKVQMLHQRMPMTLSSVDRGGCLGILWPRPLLDRSIRVLGDCGRRSHLA